MEIVTMGKATVPARIENLEDLFQAEREQWPAKQVRSIEVSDALVDTGATLLSVPAKFVRKLGLKRTRTRTARTAAGIIQFGIYQAVRLTVEGRDCIVEVAEVPDDCPVLIGQIPLEVLDFVVDPSGQKLIGNPDHGGEQMIDMF
jgi:predicted aspartyl protease